MLQHAEKVIVTCMLAFVFGIAGIGVAGTAWAEQMTATVVQTTELKTTEQQIEMLLKMIQDLQRQVLEMKAQQGGQPLSTEKRPMIEVEKKNLLNATTSVSNIQKCVAINRYLSAFPGQNSDGVEGQARGTDGEVRRLQQFLKDQGLFEGEPTGFFGPATEVAVQRFQAKHAVVKEGTPETTGYGAVGPSTRMVIRRILCGELAGELKPVPVEKKIVPIDAVKREPTAVQKVIIPIKVSETSVVSGKVVSVGIGRVDGVHSYRYVVRCEKGAFATRNGVSVCGQVNEWSIVTDANTYFEYVLTNTADVPVPVIFEIQAYKDGVIIGKGSASVKILPGASNVIEDSAGPTI